MVRVLLLSHDYQNPERVSFRRVGALVRHLSRLGDHVTVASAITGPAKGEWGEEILCLKTRSKTDGPVKSISDNGGPKQGMFDRSTPFWIAKFLGFAPLRKAALDADVVMATYGPAGPAWAAYFLSIVTGRPLVLDFRDVPESRTRKNWLSLGVDRLLESIIIRRAAIVFTVGDVLSEYLDDRHPGQKFYAMYNGWSDGDIEYRDFGGEAENYLYYAGTVYEHRLQAFSVLCGALASVDVRCKVRLIGNNTSELRDIARSCGVENKVEILGRADAATVMVEQSKAKAVLVLESLGVLSGWEAGTVTGKLIGLIASRRPGLAICGENSEISRIVRQFPWWRAASDSQTLSGLLSVETPAAPKDWSGPLESLRMERQVEKFRGHLLVMLSRQTRREAQ